MSWVTVRQGTEVVAFFPKRKLDVIFKNILSDKTLKAKNFTEFGCGYCMITIPTS